MNFLWKAVPRLLSSYDRYVLRSFIAYRASRIYSIIHEAKEPGRCKVSDAEVWVLIACIAVRAHDHCRGERNNGVENIWVNLAASLFRRYGRDGLADGQDTSKWSHTSDLFRWMQNMVEERFLEYANNLEADIFNSAKNPHFWSGDLKVQIKRRVFVNPKEQDSPRCDLLAYEIASELFPIGYSSINDFLSNPSIRRFVLLWYSNLLDSFWVSYSAYKRKLPLTTN